jgi:autotransporter-associated beta strand protein
MRGKAGLFSRFVAPAMISFDGSDGGVINVGGASRSGTVTYTGAGHTTSRVFNLAGTSGGAAFDSSGTGPLVLTEAFTYMAGAKTLTLTGTNTGGNSLGVIANAGGQPVSVVKTGTGLWTFSATSTYTGSTAIVRGTVVAGVNSQNNGNGAFGYSNNGYSQDATFMQIGDSTPGAGGFAALLMAQNVSFARFLQVPALGAGGTQAAIVGGAGTSGTSYFTGEAAILAGRDLTLQAAAGGTVDFANYWSDVTGYSTPAVNFTVGTAGNTGTVLVSGDLSTSGAITLAYGTLKVTGTIASTDEIVVDGAGTVLVYNGTAELLSPLTLTQGTLAGTSEINVPVTAGTNAILSPGDPVGSQLFSAGLTLASGGTYRWQINNWTGSAGSGFDQLAVSGDDLSITATTGSKFTLEIVGLTAGNVSGAVPNFDNTTSKSFTIATAGTLAGFSAGKFTINDAEFTNNNDLDGGTWSLANSGDDIVLTFTPS